MLSKLSILFYEDFFLREAWVKISDIFGLKKYCLSILFYEDFFLREVLCLM